MSERNTAMLMAGHVPVDDLLAAFAALPDAGPLLGEEAPRIGYGCWRGQDFTYVGWRLFEVVGFALLEELDPQDGEEPEVLLGEELSKLHHRVVYLLYDEERGFGGFSLFEAGRLNDRKAVDGRWDVPVRRSLVQEDVLDDLDPSDWVWPLLGDVIEEGASTLGLEGLRNDDDIEQLIAAAGARPHEVGERRAQSEESRPRKRDRLLGALRGLLKR